jgi:hypothetical protein
MTGVRLSPATERLAAARSSERSSVDETKTRSRRSGVRITDVP